jgi:heme/copper-type cytochrome/quinol oxidase subunit 2
MKKFTEWDAYALEQMGNTNINIRKEVLRVVTTSMWIIVLVSFIALLLTIAASRQQKRISDKSTNATTAKHPILANPILIAYIVFPVLILIGIAFILLNP